MASRSLVNTSRMFKQLEISRCFKYSLLFSDNFYSKNTHLRRWKSNRRFCTSSNLADKDKEKHEKKDKQHDHPLQLIHDHNDKDVLIHYCRGLPQVTVPLPSRKEKCRFTLRPISNTVGDFLEMLKAEDRGIDRVSVLTTEGIRIASSNTIEALLEENFKLVINDNTYLVNAPSQERLTKEEVQRLSDVRNLVHQLYEVMNVEEHQLQKERELFSQLELLRAELEPMELKRQELEVVAERRTNILTWVGLGLMSVQFGILARLTWWEYSWDIMEPVTYFVTYGTAMAGYAYFVLTKQEYMLPEVKDRQHLLTLHKKARKLGLDLVQYNSLKDKIRWLEKDLRRLRDPLHMRLPPTYTAQFQETFIPTRKETTLEKLKRLVTKTHFKQTS